MDPRRLPRSYPEMLQDVIGIYHKLLRYDGTAEKQMAAAMVPALVEAQDQLERLEKNAMSRMGLRKNAKVEKSL